MFRFLPVALLFASSLFLISCDKDISEENGELPGGNPNAVSAVCKLCRYIPQCDGSVYTYSDTVNGAGGPSNSFTLNYVKDTVIEGKTYQKFLTNGTASYYNCTAGVSTTVSVNGTTTGGAPVSFLKLTLLRANDFPGAMWADTYDLGGGQTAKYSSTLLEKNITRTVKGVSYADVAHVKVVLSVESTGVPPLPVATSDYYYAVGTGLIDYSNTDALAGQTMRRVLVAAIIP